MGGNHVIDLKGQRFGRLRVEEFDSVRPQGGAYWRCICDCGGEIVAKGYQLRTGKTKSCGCLHREIRGQLGQRSLKHGHSRGTGNTPYYRLWRSIKTRCLDSGFPRWKDWGGRGIKMHEPWQYDFERFFADVMAEIGLRPRGLTFDRIDNDGDYQPGNIQWATPAQQNRNRRVNHMVEYRGVRMTITDACKMANANPVTVIGRVCRGWSLDRALQTPALSRRRRQGVGAVA